jgi:hypothetical protein
MKQIFHLYKFPLSRITRLIYVVTYWKDESFGSIEGTVHMEGWRWMFAVQQSKQSIDLRECIMDVTIRL